MQRHGVVGAGGDAGWPRGTGRQLPVWVALPAGRRLPAAQRVSLRCVLRACRRRRRSLAAVAEEGQRRSLRSARVEVGPLTSARQGRHMATVRWATTKTTMATAQWATGDEVVLALLGLRRGRAADAAVRAARSPAVAAPPSPG